MTNKKNTSILTWIVRYLIIGMVGTVIAFPLVVEAKNAAELIIFEYTFILTLFSIWYVIHTCPNRFTDILSGILIVLVVSITILFSINHPGDSFYLFILFTTFTFVLVEFFYLRQGLIINLSKEDVHLRIQTNRVKNRINPIDQNQFEL